MTPKQFWEDNPDDLWAYWDAYQEKQKEMAEYDNVKAFNQGQYFLCAIAQCLQFTKHPKQIYPKKPFPLTNNKKVALTQTEISEIRKIKFMQMAKQFQSQRK